MIKRLKIQIIKSLNPLNIPTIEREFSYISNSNFYKEISNKLPLKLPNLGVEVNRIYKEDVNEVALLIHHKYISREPLTLCYPPHFSAFYDINHKMVLASSAEEGGLGMLCRSLLDNRKLVSAIIVTRKFPTLFNGELEEAYGQDIGSKLELVLNKGYKIIIEELGKHNFGDNIFELSRGCTDLPNNIKQLKLRYKDIYIYIYIYRQSNNLMTLLASIGLAIGYEEQNIRHCWGFATNSFSATQVIEAGMHPIGKVNYSTVNSKVIGDTEFRPFGKADNIMSMLKYIDSRGVKEYKNVANELVVVLGEINTFCSKTMQNMGDWIK